MPSRGNSTSLQILRYGWKRRVHTVHTFVEPSNGDVIVEPSLRPWHGRASGVICVIIVGSVERFAFGADLLAARVHARLEAQRRGTRALERVGSHYLEI